MSVVCVEETKLSQADRSEAGGSQSNHRKNEGSVREQIKQVVTELEDVLSGLKQVQLEMKEVSGAMMTFDLFFDELDLFYLVLMVHVCNY